MLCQEMNTFSGTVPVPLPQLFILILTFVFALVSTPFRMAPSIGLISFLDVFKHQLRSLLSTPKPLLCSQSHMPMRSCIGASDWCYSCYFLHQKRCPCTYGMIAKIQLSVKLQFKICFALPQQASSEHNTYVVCSVDIISLIFPHQFFKCLSLVLLWSFLDNQGRSHGIYSPIPVIAYFLPGELHTGVSILTAALTVLKSNLTASSAECTGQLFMQRQYNFGLLSPGPFFFLKLNIASLCFL